MPEVDPEPSPDEHVPASDHDLRGRVPGHSVIEQLLACQQRTAASRPLDDDLRCSLDPEAESWYSGALGEIRVGRMLATLADDWTVLHSVPVGERGSDIDHIVISAAGVYIINTKRHFGKRVWAAGHGLRVENHQAPYLRNLELELSRTEHALKQASGLAVDAVGVIAIVDAAAVTVTAPASILHREAHVLDAGSLVGFLGGRRRVFSDEQVVRITAAAVRPETWAPGPLEAADGDVLQLEFESLRARVEGGMRSGPGRPAPAPRSQRTPPVLGTARPRTVRRSHTRRRSRAFANLVGAVVLIAGGVWLLPHILQQYSGNDRATAFASAADEQAALIELAGTAALLIDQHSPAGVRPEGLVLSPGSSMLQTMSGTTLVDLPDGSAATYVPSADLLTYTLTLTGPQFGTTVTVSPEAGVVPAS